VGESGIDVEPADADRFAALRAIAEFSLVDAGERSLDAQLAVMVATASLLGHRLRLHGVHARDSANALLIELNGSAIFRALGQQSLDIAQFADELGTEALAKRSISVVHWRVAWHSDLHPGGSVLIVRQTRGLRFEPTAKPQRERAKPIRGSLNASRPATAKTRRAKRDLTEILNTTAAVSALVAGL
jgi:hypothetical protein